MPDKTVYNIYISTNVGNIRQNNEDNFAVNSISRSLEKLNENLIGQAVPQPFMCAVFDGMGGEACGEAASEISAVIAGQLYEYLRKKPEKILSVMKEYVRFCNLEIQKELKKNNSTRGGTTFAMAYIYDDIVYTFSIGDSRIYLYSDGKLQQISKDHTLAMKKYYANIFTLEEALNSPDKHKLTDYLGVSQDRQISAECYPEFKLRNGDKLLLCSDGLYDMCSDKEIAEILAEAKDKKSLQLVKKAISNGGEDNITCIVIEREESV